MSVAGPSPSRSENNATSTSKHASSPAPARKSYSCVMCRSRKVRCDKQSPCFNCRRGNIVCVFPSADRPPRWARRLDRLTTHAIATSTPTPQTTDPSVAKVMERLRTLESLVKELSGQLEQAHAAAGSSGNGSSAVDSSKGSQQDDDVGQDRGVSPVVSSGNMQKQFGRLVLQDESRSHYVSSGFWSRINDELDGLKMETHGLAGDESDSSEDEKSPDQTSSTYELDRTPAERHAFLFRHNLSPSAIDLCDFHPLPSQIPFLLDVFSENVNFISQIVHMPTVTKMVRDWRGSGMTKLTPANEALLFSIYYAAITSMEEDDIVTNFGSSKSELNLKYRLGLEHALAKADFLNAPNMTLVQAFGNFLSLVRRHDSPRFVWMMTGLLIRMAHYLGLHRDGSHFEHLSPYDVEMRRRVWWCVCMLDSRASEDQGTDLTITNGSFDTRIPLNLNDADIDPDSKEAVTEREGVTDMTFARTSFGLGETARRMMAPGAMDGATGLQDQGRLLKQLYEKVEQGYLQHGTESNDITYWVAVTIARLMMAKMTLIVFLPVLFSSTSEHFSDGMRTKLLVSAIEVAEYNHELNAEQKCRKWRWVYQTYTHWWAIVYLLIEISRRPWSSTIERAWTALHSSWLIPAQNPTDKNLRIWIPLRKLMGKARKYRDAELSRLRADPQAAARLESEDQSIPVPSSSGPLPAGSSVDIFHERWRLLVGMESRSASGTQTHGLAGTSPVEPSIQNTHTSQSVGRDMYELGPDDMSSNMTFEPMYYETSVQQAGHNQSNTNNEGLEPESTVYAPIESSSGQPAVQPPNTPFSASGVNSTDGRTMGLGFVPWLWADANPSVDVFSNLDMDYGDVDMDSDNEVDWYNWIESAKGLEMGGPML